LCNLINNNSSIDDHRDASGAPALLQRHFGIEREGEESNVDACCFARAGGQVEHARPYFVRDDPLKQPLLPREGLLAAVDGCVERAEVRGGECHWSSTGRQSPSPK